MNKLQIAGLSVLGVIVLVAGITGGYFIGEKYGEVKPDKPTVTIVKEGPVRWKVIAGISTAEDLEKWANAPLNIEGKIQNGNEFLVIADDTFKHAEKVFTLGAKVPDKKNVLIFNLVSGINYKFPTTLMFGGQVLYYRMFFSAFGMGGGVTVTNQTFLLNAGVIVKF